MQIILPYEIKEKLRLYVHALDNEISGFGKIKFDLEADTCTVVDIRIFKQTVSKGSTELEGEDIAKFITDSVKAGETLEGWNLWWHSHNDMGVFWSGTDDATMESNPLGAQHMLSIVTNNKGEYKARLDIYEPTHMKIDDISIVEEIPQDDSMKEEIEKEVKELVNQKIPIMYQKPKTPPHRNNDPFNWNRYETNYDKDFKTKDKNYLTQDEIDLEAEIMAKEYSLKELTTALKKAEEETNSTFSDEVLILEKAIWLKDEELEEKELEKEIIKEQEKEDKKLIKEL